ncbi:MAG TPA: IPT/TIG domain-containing protein, partial [Vulgatibacter sp.]
MDDGSLEVTLPPGDAPGPVDVRVFGEEGHAFLRKAFEYVAPLRIDSVEPPGGPLAGGGRIHVKGTGFSAGATIVLDGVPLSTRHDSSVSVSALAPPGVAPGAVSLEVTSAGRSATTTWAYVEPCDGGTPRIYAISPAQGSVDGGDAVTLVGSCLDDEKLAVRFGASFSPEAEGDDPHFVHARTPAAGAAGSVDVELRLASGADSLPGSFRYVSPISIGSASPDRGGVEGGTPIRVFGSGFPEGARLFVGALEATDVVRVGDGELRAVTPHGTDGAVPLRIVDPTDPSHEAVLAGAFRYEGPLSLVALEPSVGAQAGGTLVTLRGSGFRAGMQVRFGQAEARSVDVSDPFTAVAISPRGNAGLVDVSVSRDGLGTATLVGAFGYVDPGSTSGGSSGGPLAGSLNLTVLDGGRESYGRPLPGATVALGIDDGQTLSGLTDGRGQLTLSSPLLVKPQAVSVYLSGFEGVTVVGQRSENLTVLLQPKGGGDGQGGLPSLDRGRISGRVWGFKRPPHIVLGSKDREVAMVAVSAPSVYHAPPFGAPMQYEVVEEE